VYCYVLFCCGLNARSHELALSVDRTFSLNR